jgi:phage gp29-like protein
MSDPRPQEISAFVAKLKGREKQTYAREVRAHLMANAYNEGFMSKNAVPSVRMVGDVLGIFTAKKGGNTGKSAAGTPVQIPPTPPFSPEQWMSAAAMAAWNKFPERAASVGLNPAPYPTASTQIEGQVPPSDPTHTQSVVSAQRVMQYLLARFNPIRGLNAERLGQYIEQWMLGFLRWQSLAWSQIKERDSDLKTVIPKRIFAVSRLEWEIIADDESTEAKQHKTALEYFYKNLTVTEALDQNTQGDVNLLIRQQMDAVGGKYAVHEIVWRPDVDENGAATLTAHFRYIPTWFFENRTGQLRYLPYELALDGIPLDAGGWMITVGDGLMIASSIAYIYKQLGLRSWANFVDKYGMPFIQGKTNAAYGSTEWQQMLDALAGIRSDGSVLTNLQGELIPLKVDTHGQPPQQEFLDRMSRDISKIWMGGDLSTHSRSGSGVGALPQLNNEDEMAEADAIMCDNALGFYVDRWVVRYLFGSAKPKAHFRIIPREGIDTEKEIAVIEFLLSVGCPVSISWLRDKFGVPEPEPTETLATPPAQPSPGEADIGKGLGASGSALTLGNIQQSAAFRRAALRRLTRAQARALKPIADKVNELRAIENDEQRHAAAQDFIKKGLPAMLGRVSDESGELVQQLEDLIGTSLVSGAVEGAVHR